MESDSGSDTSDAFPIEYLEHSDENSDDKADTSKEKYSDDTEDTTKTEKEKEEKDCICAVCQCEMTVEAFSQSASTGPEGDAFRLSCKHAFHSSCILFAFRTSSSTACPCCRNTENTSTTYIRRGFSLQITELGEDTEESEEVDMLELMDNDSCLRSIRTGNETVKTKRKQFKETRKSYNIYRDTLRNKRRDHVKKALKQFRTQYREEFRTLQASLLQHASDLYEAEKTAYINLTSVEQYDALPWKEAHEQEKEGIQFKVNRVESRKTDPWNSAFWYA
jgi:hypothetical protein